MTARWIGSPDPYVGLAVGTFGEVRQGAAEIAGTSYSAVFTWSVPGYDEAEETYCTPADYELVVLVESP